ncbi:HlyD family efflux transporter periplasmic adaptor subunit [Methylomonas sp. SURF-1]|uniref:HlyD family efflux transporter periplasmic adaptor subunit n=1 Tax=Methylomonas aurea TaxID=2952224 RepID=A0ABT1UDQ8_9GAMM|nr:HlyD family efflux transporter periplasmic adaptor subunit [Methylomonas sp. SURF-1]MCQ8180295.1 HlyD family efflux transporter periplasmic adaptor subunit [Methylomonas sp. SURF-1]
MQKTIRPREILQQRRRRLRFVTMMLLLAALAYGLYWWLTQRDWVKTDDAFIAGHLIGVKAQVDGTVVEILAENTQAVNKGDVLVRLDGSYARVAVQQAEAELAKTVREFYALKARLASLGQRLVAKQAAVTQVEHDLQRFKAAAGDGAVSDQQVQNAEDKLRELAAAIRETSAEQDGVAAQLRDSGVEDYPAVEQAKSRLRRAYLDYLRREVRAPVAGYVAKRKVQVGDNLHAGAALMVVVPLEELWVEANFLETQIADIRPGQAVEIRVDAFGGERLYHGRVQGLNPGSGSSFALLPTDNATGNFIHIAERVQVRIALAPEELRAAPLQPGLSTLTRVRIADTGTSALASEVRLAGAAYRTDIYDHELDGVEDKIREIIAANRS